MSGVSSLEIAKSDCVVIWGTNAVATQVNLMTHAIRARKERGAKIVAIDIYDNETMRQADLALRLKPGTDGALACAVMHVLFRDGWADRDYMARHTDDPQGLEAHVRPRDPCWASAITGLAVEDIEAFAALVGRNKRTFFRLGYGFTRQRNGASNMHAAVCIPAVTGAWAHEGGGALHSNSGIYKLDKTLIEGLDARDTSVRRLDQSRIGAVLTGEAEALKGGGPVKAMLIQNTNPMVVAPNQAKVRRGFSREDLFTCVHEQFLTDTARHADIVLPATMFLEHDDHLHRRRPSISAVRRQDDRAAGGLPLQPRSDLRAGEAPRRRASRLPDERTRDHRRDVARFRPRDAGRTRGGALARLPAAVRGGAFPERLRARGPQVSFPRRLAASASCHDGLRGAWSEMPDLPDHWAVNEAVDEAHPFKLATSPARNFLNSSFNQTATSVARETRPTALMHPDDAAALGLAEGDVVRLGNTRGSTRLHVRLFAGPRGVIVSEGLWENGDFLDGRGINTLTGDDSVAPFGGAAFHDARVWARAEGTLPKEENAEIEVAKKAEAVVFG